MKKSFKLPIAIFSTGILSFGGVVIETAMNVTFPKLMNLFNVSFAQVQWITTSYLLVLTVMMPLSAFLNKNFQARKLFVTAALCFLAGVSLDAVAPSLMWLLVGRLLQGIGTGISLPLMFNIILAKAPAQKLGMLMGLGNFVTATAPAIGPIYGGILVETIGWRWIFILMIPLILIALVAGSQAISIEELASSTKFDLIGWSLAGMIFTFLIIGFSFLSSNLFIFAFSLILAIVSMGLTKFHYHHTAVPVLNWKMLKSRTFVLHLSSYFIGQFAVLGLSFLIPNMVQVFFKQTSFQAGLTMAPGALVGALATIFGGILLDRLGAKKPILLGVVLQTLTVTIFAIFLKQLNVSLITLLFILFALGQSLSMPNIMTNGLRYLPIKDQADGNALFNTFQQFAGANGTAIISAIVAMDGSTSKFLGFHYGFGFCGAILLIDLFVLWNIFKGSDQEMKTK
ncbi:MFS transporter [Liquorilactobacillus sicerae]|uniref:MFS transporter n=1 Tax=Liquorilactobacillus sicerae TaxID=1416943 RepID=UPI0024808215